MTFVGIPCVNCRHDVMAHGTLVTDKSVCIENNCMCSRFEISHEPAEEILYGQTYFLLPKSQMLDLVKDYVSKIEMELSAKWCKCEWITHPDDTEIDPHNCANCRHPHLLHKNITPINKDLETDWICNGSLLDDENACGCTKWLNPPKRRMRRGDQNPECPVHTKEGLVLGFFEHLFPADIKE